MALLNQNLLSQPLRQGALPTMPAKPAGAPVTAAPMARSVASAPAVGASPMAAQTALRPPQQTPLVPYSSTPILQSGGATPFYGGNTTVGNQNQMAAAGNAADQSVGSIGSSMPQMDQSMIQPYQAPTPMMAPQIPPPMAQPNLPIQLPPQNPMNASFQGLRPPVSLPTPAPVAPTQAPGAPPNQSLEQQALNGGGVDNKQQVSNFMTALHNVNGGNQNAFMNVPNAPQAQQGPLVTLPPTQQQQQAQQAQMTQNVQQATSGQPTDRFMGFTPSNPAPAPAPAQQPGPNIPFSNQSLVPQQAPAQTPNPSRPWQGAVASDEQLKTGVAPAESSLMDFMSKIGAHNYQYKNPELDGVGTFTSPMAQELEKTELGRQAVLNTPRGKLVDYARLGGVNLAALSVVHREQQRLEAQVKSLRDAVRKRSN